MSYLAPYTSAMRIGQGFNSYTQEICMVDAVIVEKETSSPETASPPAAKSDIRSAANDPVKLTNGTVPSKDASHSDAPKNVPISSTVNAADQPNAPKVGDVKDNAATTTVTPKAEPPAPWSGVPVDTKQLNQIVTFSSRSVENMSEIMSALNISAYASIKYGTVTGGGSASYINENKVIESDINYIVTVKVTNEIEELSTPMTFNEVDQLPGQDFTRIYGDCFIAGFLKGGEFSAIISVKLDDQSKKSQVKAALDLSLAAPVPGLTAGGGFKGQHMDDAVWAGTEMTISVNWYGGGMVKKPETIWTLQQITIAANEFPNLVSREAQCTSAVLMKYTSLKSFHDKNAARTDKYQPADYSTAGPYTADLFSAYITYKSLWKDISTMLQNPDKWQQRNVAGAIGADPESLNKARIKCRIAMTRIIKEVDRIATNPEAVIDHLYEPDDDDSTAKSTPEDQKATEQNKVNGEESVKKETFHPSHPLYTFPAVLRARLPQPTARSSPDLVNIVAEMKPEEILKIQPYVRSDKVNFDTLVGLRSSSRDNHSFISINTEPDKELDLLTYIRLHTHQHKAMDVIEEILHDVSGKASHFLTAIGFRTNHDSDPGPTTHVNTKQCTCGGANHVGSKHNLSQAEPYLSAKAQMSFSSGGGITKVVIGYEPKKGWIGSLRLYGQGFTVLEWRRDDSVSPENRLPLHEVTQLAPDGGASSADGEGNHTRWILGGFHGEADLLITRLGAIWIRV